MRYVWDMHKICMRYAWDMSEICLGCDWDWDMPGIFCDRPEIYEGIEVLSLEISLMRALFYRPFWW